METFGALPRGDDVGNGFHLSAITTSPESCTPSSKGATTVICDLGDIAKVGETNSRATVRIQVHANANVNFVASVASDINDPNSNNNKAFFSSWAVK